MKSFVEAVVENRVVVFAFTLLVVGFGLVVAPFDSFDVLPRDPIAIDAIPDIGENQQIVFTRWEGRSPQDIDDQITYPLTTALLGVSGVRAVRGSSMFGFSSVYVIFDDGVDFYESRARLLEKLSALPGELLPDNVTPTMGPDATGLGQVFWYVLQAHDETGSPVSAWDLHELRTVQDWSVRTALQSVPGVAEVASIGGTQKQFQIEVDPDALETNRISLQEVASAIRSSNLDVGARTLELNQVEYVVRGIGSIASIADLENVTVVHRENQSIRLMDIAKVFEGPASRRGALDVDGAEAVGGVVVARFGQNPMSVLQDVRKKVDEINDSLPTKTLSDGRIARLSLVPVYDRSTLIQETVQTLNDALLQQLLITLIVILLMLGRLKQAFVVAVTLPLAVLMSFIAMKLFGVTANVMSLAGIAIAIGTMVDVGIIFVENVAQQKAVDVRDRVVTGISEVLPAVLTSIATTVVGFLPIFALTAAEGKLFTPLALTKTFAMVAAVIAGTTLLPALVFVGYQVRLKQVEQKAVSYVAAGALVIVLGLVWRPIGYGSSAVMSVIFVFFVCLLVIGGFRAFERSYRSILEWTLQHKAKFAVAPVLTVLFAMLAFFGFPKTSFFEEGIGHSIARSFPGFQSEFMPAFDEGSFLYMPTTMPHASIGTALNQMRVMDARIAAIPEVERVVGKIGRAETALDPAPVSMFETLVTYKPEWRIENGERVRNWREHIRTSDDIWNEIVAAGHLPGTTSAPKLMPIETRIIMLQTGMRAPMGIKVSAESLPDLERAVDQLEREVRKSDWVDTATVFAEKLVGKPYLEIHVDRSEISRFGVSMAAVQKQIQMAIGGSTLTQVIDGRERIGVTLRYPRSDRQSLKAISKLSIPTPSGSVLLGEVAKVVYVRGPQVIKSEDGLLTAYITFGGKSGVAEETVVEKLRAEIDGSKMVLPSGARFRFSGNYENQIRSMKTLRVVVPVAFLLIFILIYLQFKSVSRTLVAYSGVAVAVAGGMILLWLYNQPWFLSFSVAGFSFREMFQVGPIQMSVAVWVGFIALVGIATDDGVVMSTYLKQSFGKNNPTSIPEIREAVIEAGVRRVRPCLMTSATTLLALMPVISATGRGSDVMAPMAVPIFGGMSVALMSLFIVPVLWSAVEERRLGSK